MYRGRDGWKKAVLLGTTLLLVSCLLFVPDHAGLKKNEALAVTPLPKVQSLEHLQELLAPNSPSQLRLHKTNAADAAPEAVTGQAKSDFSATNVQVEGVDEADLVKTDGSYIYQVTPQAVQIIQAVPASQLRLTAHITLESPHFTPSEIYVAGHQLVIIGNGPSPGPYRVEPMAEVRPPFYPGNSATQILIYNIEDPNHPEKIRQLELDGTYLTSRRVNSALYVISHQPAYQIRADSPLPGYRDSVQGEQISRVPVNEISYFPNSVYPSYVLMAGLRLDQPHQAAQVEVVLGSAENVYASADGFYVAAPLSRLIPAVYDRTLPIRNEDRTQIFKFSLNQGRLAYAARGEVPGHTLNQFSMDEYQGIFRIATNSGREWWRNQPVTSNNIYTLDSSLNLLGRLENIAPGEYIYSTRFMGNRLYMVTFRTVDPFFTIDLSNPQSPCILGQLKIPGYSNYLHPYDENSIIGFGKDTIELKGPYGEAQAYYQGMKLALFDVSDVAQPIEKDRDIIGDRGTDSDLLNNHRALLFSREKNLLAFPVTVRQVQPNGSDKLNDRLEYGSFAFQGAYVYHIDAEKLTLKGRITHLTPEDYLKAGDYWGTSERSVQRILYIGDTLYTLSPAMIQAHRLEDLTWISSLPLQP